MTIELGIHMTNPKAKIENYSVVNKNWKSTLFEGAIFRQFWPKIQKLVFSITISGYIAMKRRRFFYKKRLCFSYVLFIFNYRNSKISFKSLINVAFMHI